MDEKKKKKFAFLRAHCDCNSNTFYFDTDPSRGDVHLICAYCGKHIAFIEPYGIEWLPTETSVKQEADGKDEHEASH